ncbi:hypothetical protein B0J14DRAFT_654691 [Halenospora varia]|nr:hypothetical protein B0J14DRAFT_654691 [Halenospora varia]
MPRKAYIADVTAANAQNIQGITSVVRGDEDGDLNVCYAPSVGVPIELSLMALDVGGYPAENTYMISTLSDMLPDGVNEALQDIQETSAGMTVPDLLMAISKKLRKVLATGTQDNPFDLDGASDVEMPDNEDEDEEEEEEEEEEYPDSDDDWKISTGGRAISTTISLSKQDAANINRRIRADLRTAKNAGFKIGILSGMKADSVSSIVSLSIKVDRLGLSEEAMQAWDLEPQQYIVLLLRYSFGYKDFETIMEQAAKACGVTFRIGISNKYKPTLVEALAAFTEVKKGENKQNDPTQSQSATQQEKPVAGFSNLFISSSLNDYINQQFVSLLKIRNSFAISWTGAKKWFNEKQSRIDNNSAELPAEYYDSDNVTDNTLPEFLSNDHLTDNHTLREPVSFPLIAAQFSLQNLVRCTQYCLVCHDKIEDDFEALKPYVCSKPLCLYQYMSLGFGPSVEHEILTQPYVVDLLVSFCYASASNLRLREYPTGMSLSVPPVTNRVTNAMPSGFHTHLSPLPAPAAKEQTEEVMSIKYDMTHQEVVLEEGQVCPVRAGDWVVISVFGRPAEHFRVEDVSYLPTIKLSQVGVTQKSWKDQPLNMTSSTTNMAPVPATPATTPPPSALILADMAVYNHNFDDMEDLSKAESIVVLLETLPSIKELKAYLTKQCRHSEPNLRAWQDRVSPAALGLLRWIIASNRSCIIQVDKCPGQEDHEASDARIRYDQKLSNIADGWVQFRFAQGAPDKEQRFLNALKQEQGNFDANFPTIFAWHGSPLPNWHSIIRHGLDFKETLHGRAYGHGVYHALDQATSTSYAQPRTNSAWKGSELQISSAMSLNEIVNCPTKFTSSNPYVVVQHVDWIQCRYLLVQTANSSDPYGYGTGRATTGAVDANSTTNTLNEVVQDSRLTAKSTLNKPVGIPLCAITTSRSFRPATVEKAETAHLAKKRRQSRSMDLTAGAASDSDELIDLQHLLSDEEDEPQGKGMGSSQNNGLKNSTKQVDTEPLTDFVPGSLDQSQLPMLDPPSYATSMATKSLNRCLKEVLEVQKKTPLHELGWYIDPELISNVYQWIVELHSFESTLPLAQDMKAAGVTSIVLEIRFGKEYPHSPPFVRVIRPRFLPFMSGGGGHVTAGGAMCMELLTNSGWSAVSSIESVLLQVRMAIMNLDPKPARLESRSRVGDYNVFEAIEAYKRACAQHGWQVPPDFGDFATDNSNPSHY